MNSSYYVYEVKFIMSDMGPNLGSKLAIKNMTAADLAKEQLFIKYPDLLTKTLISTNKYDDFYAFAFDSNFSASVRFTNFKFEPNKPIQTNVDMPYYDAYYGYDYFYGGRFGFYNMFSFLDNRYNSCLNLAMSEVP